MNPLFLLSCAFLTLSSGAVVRPSASSDSSEVIQAVERNLSFGAPAHRFDISASFVGPKLPLISCLMDTVYILVQLSRGDFWGTIGAGSWRMQEYPEIGIMILPTLSGGRIQRRFVIWAFSQGTALMMNRNCFQSVAFTIKWEGVRVGTLEFMSWRKLQSEELRVTGGATQGFIRDSPTVTPNVSVTVPTYSADADLVQTVNDQGLVVKTSLVGSTVKLLDVFRLVITVIVDAAKKKPTERIHEGYVSPRTIPGVLLSFYVPTSAPEWPPFFEIQYLIKSVALIPTYMIKKGIFQEASFLLEVDGQRIANGFLEKKPPSVDLLSGPSNISVS